MFGSNILDVAVGLILIYLLMSLIASAIREAVEAIVQSRAVELERGIRTLLDDPAGTGLARALYEHPLVYSLYAGRYENAAKRFRGRNLPTYIPAKNFSAALLDMALRGTVRVPYAAQQTHPTITVASLRASVHRIPSPFVQRVLLSAIDNAKSDVDRVRTNLEAWFDSAMDRVSGAYKRRTQAWLFVIGLGLTLALNVNTVTIADYLARNEEARAALLRRAQEVRGDTTYRRLVSDSVISEAEARAVYSDLQSLSLPIGWDRQLPLPREGAFWYVVKQIAGLFVTALAIMLGAPFWFDLLNKFMVIRSTVKPREKSPEEDSEDRQKKSRSRKDGASDATSTAAAAAAGAAAGVAAGAGGAGAAAGASGLEGVPDSGAVGVLDPEPPHTDNKWVNEVDPEEGII